MPDASNAIWIIVVSNLITAAGAFFAARAGVTGERATDVFQKSIQELRSQIADRDKRILELRNDFTHLELKTTRYKTERNAYIILSQKLDILARRHAPRGTVIPDVELNTDTPPRI